MKKLYNTDKITLEKGLSEKSFKDITDIFEACGEAEKPSPSMKEKDNEYLLYGEDTIVGYVGIFSSYKKGETRLRGMVHPDYRKKGVFSELFEAAKVRCRERGCDTMVLINKQSSESGKAFIASTGAEFKNAMYEMELEKTHYQGDAPELLGLSVRAARREDLDAMVEIGMKAFGTTEEEERPLNERNLTKEDRNIYVAEYEGRVVGMVTAIIENQKAYICDLSVHPDYQRKGIGRNLLLKTVGSALAKKRDKISLSVEAENRNALALYEYSGFRVTSATDFYTLHIG